MSADPLDWSKLGLPPELATAPTVEPEPKPAIKRSNRPFIKFPLAWQERLAHARSPNTYRVALHLLQRHWQTNLVQLELANLALTKKGVDRKKKTIALRELQDAGLIVVEYRGRKSPLVRLFHVG
jgi:hypothetical protein